MRVTFAAAAAAVALCATSAFAAPPTYTATFLGSFGGNITGLGMNNAGNVVGQATIAGNSDGQLVVGGNNGYAFFSDGSTTTRFLGGLFGSTARKINNHGLLVGTTPDNAVIFDVTTNTVVKDAGSTSEIRLNDINDAGFVTGSFRVTSSLTLIRSAQHAFFYDGSTLHDLGTPPGATSSEGLAINNLGHIVGIVDGDAFFSDGTGMTRLPELATNAFTRANDINDLDQAVGVSGNHAVMWDSAGLHDIGLLGAVRHSEADPINIHSEAKAINNHGEIVGSNLPTPLTLGSTSTFHAFYSNGTTFLDLNNMIDPSDPNYGRWIMTDAVDINDIGQITAIGCFVANLNVCYTFLLTPVPAP